jgi:hybrid cluster-associated redox disulfide protein
MIVNKDMKVCDVLEIDDKLEEIFTRYGLYCVGCPGGRCETLSEAAEGHGIGLEHLLEDINKALT